MSSMKTTSGQRSSSKDNGLRDLFERLDEHVPYVQDNLDPILDSGETLIFSDVRHDLRAPETLRQIQLEDESGLIVIGDAGKGHSIGTQPQAGSGSARY